MAILKPSQLRLEADAALQQSAYNPKMLVLIHTAVSLGLAVLITSLNFYLNQQIADTGGLAGLGTRSILTTIQTMLQYGNAIALPFWEAGLIFSMLCWLKGESAGPASLLQGFRRFGQIVLLRFVQGLLFFSLAMATLTLCLTIYLATPMSESMMALMEPLLEDAVSAEQAQAMMQEADFLFASTEAMLPMLGLFLLVFAVIALPLFYRMRFAIFSVMDGSGALAAIVHSSRMTKKNRLQLVKLDLSFWWFYLLQLLCMALCYGDLLLPMLNIQLPFQEDTAFFLFFLLGTLCQGALLWYFRAHVLTTYGAAYRQLWQKPPSPREENLPFRV